MNDELMCALAVSSRQTQVIWLSAFFSPTIYFVLLMAAGASRLPAPPETLVAGLFFLTPVAALAVCETVVWKSGLTTRNKVLWTLFTLLGIAAQFVIAVLFISAFLTAAISLP
jgi:hypothetical protein